VTSDEVGLVCYLTLSWGIVFRLGIFRGVPGKCGKRYHAGTNRVLLDSNVRMAFRSDKAVNKVLRSVIELRRVRSYEIDDVRLPLGYGAGDTPTVRTALSVVLTPLPLHAASRRFPFDPPGMSTCPLAFQPIRQVS
jgi:hypothetical protein